MDSKILFEINKFCGKPSTLLFTDRKRLPNLLEIIKNLPKNSTIIFREYDLSEKQREEFLQEIRQVVNTKLPSRRPKILVGKNWRLAKKIRADGVHFSDRDLSNAPRKLTNFLRRRFCQNFLISYATHSAKSALQASFSNLDLIVISPVFKTDSHFGTRALGLKSLAKISSKISATKIKNDLPSKKFYALGGVNEKNLRSVRKLNIGGFGAINFFGENL
jgi:thiamine monophosphate synthase